MLPEPAAPPIPLDNLSQAELQRLLASAGLADWASARDILSRLASTPQASRSLASLMPHLLEALARVASPDRVLVNLERLARAAGDTEAMLASLAGQPRAVEILATLFSSSQFLTEILLRQPSNLRQLMDHHQWVHQKGAELLAREAAEAAAGAEDVEGQLGALRRLQRRELLRIGVCDLLGLLDLPAVTWQLSNLADALVEAALTGAARQAGIAAPPPGLAVIAMGKLGGQELNYSSDIDLLFLNAAEADYRRVGERLIDALTRMTAEGFLYRVDMRLRPWGQVGALVTSLEGYLAYLRQHARLWERQALLKARVIAGDRPAGEAALRAIEPLIYGDGEGALDPEVVRAEVHAMKQRTESDLRQRGQSWGEVKLGEGTIRDIEFVAQYLQLAYGGELPELRSPTTLDALGRLAAAGLLTGEERRILADGYILMRTIEHHLQMMHYRQTHALPSDPQALAHLAKRLGFQGPEAAAAFIARYDQYRAAIRAIYTRYLGSSKMADREQPEPSQPQINRHLARLDPSYAAVFSESDIARHALLAEQLDANNLVQVDTQPLPDGAWRVSVIAYDYPGELSLICGLLFVYGLSILDGDVFTYEPLPAAPETAAPAPRFTYRRPLGGSSADSPARQKIVDVFTVRPEYGEITAETWARYAADLEGLLRLMHEGQRTEARGWLAKRVATALHGLADAAPTLYPIEIEVDNESSERYTVLHITAADTIGFLYELTNALAMSRMYIARVMVDSVGSRVEDTLYITDENGRKVTDPERERELRAAIVLTKHFTHLLPQLPNPESALLHFRQFMAQLFERPDWSKELASLERPEVLHALARVLGVSDFLWDDFLRMQHANLFPVVRDVGALETAKTRDELQRELERELRPVHDGPQAPRDDAPWRAALNAFKDREMFRIDMRHILGHTVEFWDFASELTDLAEVVVNAAYHLSHEDLRSVYGAPLLEDGQPSEMAVCALGKCGGRELGFASDIELMFIYAGNGRTGGPQVITTSEFYEKVVESFVKAIEARREGIFEIDLQLRPYGKAGSMAVSLESFRRYFAPEGPAWAYERQALVKLRPIAGNPGLGAEVLRLRDEVVYSGQPFDVTAMRAMRERQIRHLVTGGTFNAKYSPGALVDVEYLVQALQISHGQANPALRRTNIREAMAALAEAGVLSAEDYAQLRRAHTFLRWLIDTLRMVRGNARDLTVPPPDSDEFAFLARRLRYGNDVARLREDLERYAASAQELSARLLG